MLWNIFWHSMAVVGIMFTFMAIVMVLFMMIVPSNDETEDEQKRLYEKVF